MDHRVDAAVDRGVVDAEVRNRGDGLAPGGITGHVQQLRHALPLGRGDGHHRHPQVPAEAPHVHRAAVCPQFVHHVQGDDRGTAQLQQLQRQVEVALDVGGVHHVDDAVRLLVDDEVPGDDLLLGVGAQGVDARQVHRRAVFEPAHLARLLLHRHAGEVSHVLVGARQGVEQRGLAAVLVSGQGKYHGVSTSLSSIFAASSSRRVSS